MEELGTTSLGGFAILDLKNNYYVFLGNEFYITHLIGYIFCVYISINKKKKKLYT